MGEKEKKYKIPELLLIYLSNDIITLSGGDGTIEDGGDNEEPWED